MNTCNRFLTSLLAEFKLTAQPHVRSLWADLEELREATDEHARSVALQQALRRIYSLERAAGAVGAHEVQTLSRVLKHTLEALAHARVATRPKLFETLDQTMNKLAEALYAIDVSAAISGHAGQPTEAALVESGTD